MRKHQLKRICAIAVAAVITLFSLVVCACDNLPAPAPEGTLESIAVTKQPNKTEYEEGEKFSRSGMRVTAYYVGGTSKTILGYKIDKDGPLTLDDTVITLTYQEKSTTVNITVTEKKVKTQLTVETGDFCTYKVEAEDCALGSGEYSTAFFEYHDENKNNPNTSGGMSLGKLNDSNNSISLKINSEVEADITIIAALSYNPSLDFDEGTDTFWNDTQISTGWTVAKRAGAEYEWFDWQEYALEDLKLNVGINELLFKVNGQSPNYDYFKVIVNPIKSEVVSIAVTTPPTKTEYIDGERFDPTGMVVTATYANELTAPIDDYDYYSEPLRLGDTAVEITFVDLHTECPITVIERDSTLDHITVDLAPYTKYNVGDYFHAEGMTVIATYKDGFSENVEGFTVDKTAQLTANDTTVTVSYEGKTTTLDITVEPTDAHITVVNNDAKTVRIEAEDAKIVYNKDSDTHKVEEPNKPTSGNKTIGTMRGTTTSVKFYVDSDVDTVADLVFRLAHPNMQFNAQAALFINGVRHDDDTSSWTLTGNEWFEWKDFMIDDCELKEGRNVIEILNLDGSKGDGGFLFDCLDVAVNPVRSIAITEAPTKTQYNLGESFNASGMVVSATYADGTIKAITDYSVEPSGALNTENTFVTVSYRGFTAQTPITVVSEATLSEIRIDVQPTKTNYFVGESFDASGMVVTAVYSDGNETPVTQYTLDKGELVIGDTFVTVSYEGKTAQVNVRVTGHISGYGQTYKLELEDAIYTYGEGNSDDRQVLVLKDNADCSGGKFLDAMDWRAGTTFDINIYSEIDCDNVQLYAAVATGGGGSLDDNWTLEWNYVEELFGIDVQNSWTPTEERLSSNNGLTLHQGWNHIRITIKTSKGINTDYIKLVIGENQ